MAFGCSQAQEIKNCIWTEIGQMRVKTGQRPAPSARTDTEQALESPLQAGKNRNGTSYLMHRGIAHRSCVSPWHSPGRSGKATSSSRSSLARWPSAGRPTVPLAPRAFLRVAVAPPGPTTQHYFTHSRPRAFSALHSATKDSAACLPCAALRRRRDPSSQRPSALR